MQTSGWDHIVAVAKALDQLGLSCGEDPVRLAQLVIEFDRNVVKKPIRGLATSSAPAPRTVASTVPATVPPAGRSERDAA
jgi:hypothetical protein